MQYGSALRAKVLILGIADRDYSYSLRDIPNSIRMIFAQNLDFVDGRFHVMSLGLEILSISVNGFTEYVDLRFRSIAKAPKILICPLSVTHSDRIKVLKLSKHTILNVVFQEERMELRTLAL